MHYVRESLCDVIFELFVRSANQAKAQSTTSSILFVININELKSQNARGLVIVLYLYKKIKQFVKLYYPYYGQIGLKEELIRLSLGAGQINPSSVRNEQNEWLETNLKNVMDQNRKPNKKEKSKEHLHLYRLLALRYRTLYPALGDKPVRVDLDLRIRLENKICQSLLRMFLAE